MTESDREAFIENLGMEAYENYMNEFDQHEGGSRPAPGKSEAIKKVDRMARRHDSLGPNDRMELIKSLRVLYPEKPGSDLGMITGKVTTGKFSDGFTTDDWRDNLDK